jgi:adenylate cyclase
VDYVTNLFFVFFVLGTSFVYKFILEGKNKEKIKNAMSKYISDDIMSEIIQNIDELKLGGKRAEVTVLFADIRGFTTISEMYEPEEVSRILNNYFSEMIPIVNKYHGVLNKFIGDALLAVFGDPIPNEDHALNAVLCADEMIKKVEDLHKEWSIKGLPNLNIGIGINTGVVFVGNIGSNARMEYTVIGDAVNVASRIEAYNKIYKTKFLISETTYQKSKDCLDVIKISEVPIRGRVETINIYEILKVDKNVKCQTLK